MGTLLIYAAIAIVVAVALFLLAAYFLPAGEQIAAPIRDEPIWTLPADRSLDPADVETVRLPVALRGYRFAETDLLLDRLAEELKLRDAEIARLRTDRASPRPEADEVHLDELHDEDLERADPKQADPKHADPKQADTDRAKGADTEPAGSPNPVREPGLDGASGSGGAPGSAGPATSDGSRGLEDSVGDGGA